MASDIIEEPKITELLTPKEVARVLRLSEEIVRRKLRTGEIPGVKVGRLWRVKQAAINLYLAKGEKEARNARVSPDTGYPQ